MREFVVFDGRATERGRESPRLDQTVAEADTTEGLHDTIHQVAV